MSFEVVDGLFGRLAILVRSWSRDAINNGTIADLDARVGIAKHGLLGVQGRKRAVFGLVDVDVSFEVVDGLLGRLAVLVGAWSRDAINNGTIADLGARVGIAKHGVLGVQGRKRAALGLADVDVSFEVVDGLLGRLAILVGAWGREAINNGTIANLGACAGIAEYRLFGFEG